MFIKVLRLRQKKRRKFLQENNFVVIASGSGPSFKVTATQQKKKSICDNYFEFLP